MSGYTKGRAAVEKVQEFPFGVRVFVGDVQVLKQDAVAFATGQKNRQDNELAIGFPADQRERIATFIKEQDANAELFAEAFNVADETGRTPAQLAAERAELVAVIEEIAGGMGNLPIEEIGDAGVHGIRDGKARAIYLERFVRMSRAILAKVKGPVQS